MTHILLAVLVLEGNRLCWEELATGSLEHCQAEQGKIDCMTYSGPHKVKEAFSKVMPKHEWEAAKAHAKTLPGKFEERLVPR